MPAICQLSILLPLYGGQNYTTQLKALKRGSQVIVGTPGRIMDHLDRGTLVLDRLRAIVLDEADEMLRMGFIDDVQTIMDATPPGRQVRCSLPLCQTRSVLLLRSI